MKILQTPRIAGLLLFTIAAYFTLIPQIPESFQGVGINVKSAGARGDLKSGSGGTMATGCSVTPCAFTDSGASFTTGDVGKAFATSLAPFHAPSMPLPCTGGYGACSTTGWAISTSAGSISGPSEVHAKFYFTNSSGTLVGDESGEYANRMGGTTNNAFEVVAVGGGNMIATPDNGALGVLVYVSADAATDWPSKTSGAEVLANGLATCGNGAPVVNAAGSCIITALPVIASSWTQNFAYSTGAMITDSNGNVEIACSTVGVGNCGAGGGTSNNSAQPTWPTWPTQAHTTTVDGTVTWTLIGPKTPPSTQWAFGTIQSVTNATTIGVSFASQNYALTNNSYEYGTDDTTAIQSALTASNGRSVFFPPGSYWINSTGLTIGTGAAQSFVSLAGAGGAGSKLLGQPASNVSCGISELVQVGNGTNALLTAGVGGTTQTNGGIHIRDLCFRDGTVSLRSSGGMGNSNGLGALWLKNEARVQLDDVSCENWTKGYCLHLDAGANGQWSQFDSIYFLNAVNVRRAILADDGRQSDINVFGGNFISSLLGGGVCVDLQSGGSFGGGGNSAFWRFHCNYFPLSVHTVDNNVNEFNAIHAEATITFDPPACTGNQCVLIGSNGTTTGVLLEGSVVGGGKCQSNKFNGGSLTGLAMGVQIGLGVGSNAYCQGTLLGLSNANNTVNVLDYSRYTTGGGTVLGGADTLLANDIQLQWQKGVFQNVDGMRFASAWCSVSGVFDDTCLSNAIANMITSGCATGASAGTGGNVLFLDSNKNFTLTKTVVVGLGSTCRVPITIVGLPGAQISISATSGDGLDVCDGSSIMGLFGQFGSTGSTKPFRIEVLNGATITNAIAPCDLTGVQTGFGLSGFQLVADAGAVSNFGILVQGLGAGTYVRDIGINGFTGVGLGIIGVSGGPTAGIVIDNVIVTNSQATGSIPGEILQANNAAVTNITVMRSKFSGAENTAGKCEFVITGSSGGFSNANTISSITMNTIDVEVAGTNAGSIDGICIKDSHDILLETIFGGTTNGADLINISSSTTAPNTTTGLIQVKNAWSQGWTNSVNDTVSSDAKTDRHIVSYAFAGGGVSSFNGPPRYTFGALPASSNGAIVFCTDCKNVADNAVAFDSTAVGSGNGTTLLRENGVWRVH